MRCCDCTHYRSGYLSNACDVTMDENFHTLENCTLVNLDGSLNYDDEFIKIEFGDKENAGLPEEGDYMFDIGKVADTVIEMCGLTGKDIDTVWKHYIHDLVKEGHSLEEVKAYIQHKQDLGAGPQEETKGCSGECDLCPEADDCEQCGGV